MKTDISEKIIKCALLYENAYIYGDYVRDIIIRKLHDFEEINIMMGTYGDKIHFINVLKLMFDDVNIDTKICINDTLNIDVAVQNDSISSSLVGGIWLLKHDTRNHFTNMSCDAFTLTSNGIQISTSIDRFFECVRDCETKQFSFVPTNTKMSEFSVIDRAVALTQDGWTMKSGGFRVDTNVHECSICLDTNYGIFLTTSCNHVFHVDCFKKAIEKKVECPMCRNENVLIKN